MIAAWLCLGMFSGAILAQSPLETRQVELSPTVKNGDRIGRMRFLGMLELPSIKHDGVRLSQLSGLAWDDDEGILYAVSDKGALFHLKPEFNGNTLAGLKILRAVTLRELGGRNNLKPSRSDAEDMDILNGRNGRKGDAELVISFERFPRIARYHPDGRAIAEHDIPPPLNDGKNYRNPNKMLESVCVDPDRGIITAPEDPLKNAPEGYTGLYSLSGNHWRYPLAAAHRITALACLGRGEVIVLQQQYMLAIGQIGITLSRVHLPATSVANPLRPETIVTLDSRDGYLIDNFEGLAHHRRGRFFMVSDNNDLFVQRTLLMYFELLDD